VNSLPKTVIRQRRCCDLNPDPAIEQIGVDLDKCALRLSRIVLLLQHPFNGLYSRTTWVIRYQKSKISLDLNEARDGGVWGWQWHQMDDMQTICTSLQTDNHTNTPSLNIFYRPDAFCLRPANSKLQHQHFLRVCFSSSLESTPGFCPSSMQ